MSTIFRENGNKKPYIHINDVENICFTFQEVNVLIEILRMKLFVVCFDFEGQAKTWLNTLRPRSIKELEYANMLTSLVFLHKFFSTL